MKTSPKRVSLVFGLVLILLGVGALLVQNVPGWRETLQRTYQWPDSLIALGAFLVLLALFSRSAGLLTLGVIMAGIGGILYYQASSGDWDSWAYLWTLIPGFVGLSVLLQGVFWSANRKYNLARGLNLLAVSAILFIVFGAIVGAFDLLSGYWPPLILIVLGVYMIVRALGGAKDAKE